MIKKINQKRKKKEALLEHELPHLFIFRNTYPHKCVFYPRPFRFLLFPSPLPVLRFLLKRTPLSPGPSLWVRAGASATALPAATPVFSSLYIYTVNRDSITRPACHSLFLASFFFILPFYSLPFTNQCVAGERTKVYVSFFSLTPSIAASCTRSLPQTALKASPH